MGCSVAMPDEKSPARQSRKKVRRRLVTAKSRATREAKRRERADGTVHVEAFALDAEKLYCATDRTAGRGVEVPGTADTGAGIWLGEVENDKIRMAAGKISPLERIIVGSGAVSSTLA